MPFANPAKIVPFFELEPVMTIADFGAGDGSYTLAMAEHVSPSSRVFAVDVQKDMLTRLRNSALERGIRNIEYIWGDVEVAGGTKLADEHIDLVLVSNVLFLSKAQYSLAKEVFRVLRPGGRAVIIDWTDSFAGMGPHPSHVVTAEGTRKIFEQAGFSFAKDFPAGDHHYGVIFTKI